MRRIAIAALLALCGALVAQVATIEPAFAADVGAITATVPGSIVFGSAANVTAGTVFGDGSSGAPTGTVTVQVDGGFDQTVALTPADTNSSTFPTVAFNGLAVNGGTAHNIAVTYNGDGTYGVSGPTQVGGVSVTPANTSVSANPSNGTPTLGASINVNGTVSGPTPFTGTVTIKEGATQLATGSVAANGNYTTTSFNSLGVGSHTLTATYGGDGNHNASPGKDFNVTVNQPATTITFTSANATTYGAAYSVAGTLTSGAGVPPGNVSISVDGGAATPVALDGAGKFTLALGLLTRASHTVKVDYAANGNFAGASNTLNLTVNKAPVTVGAATPTSSFPGQTIPVVVSVVPTGTLLPGVAALTGTVTAPNSDGPKALASGAATVTLNPISGNVNAAFTYSGDNNYAAGGITKTITFSKYQLELGIADVNNCESPAPSCANVPPGVPMPLKAVLTLAAGQPTPPAGMNPTGSIHFTDSRNVGFWNPQNPGIVVSGSGWAAATIAQFQAAGADNVTASYAGNANFAPVDNTASPLQVGVPNSDHNTRYVYWVYNDLLGRGPDPAGLSYWVGLLNANPPTPRPAVAWALVNSTEYRADVIDDLYVHYLGRHPDQGGLNYWVGQVAGGMTFEWFQSFLAGSDEYYIRADKGGSNPTKFVTSMYQDVLGRGPDAGGLNFFVSQLNAGVPRARIVAAIVFSTENLSAEVNDDYQHFLSRNSDPGGLNYWVGQLQRGTRDEVIVALIVGSDEYFALV